jgi:hypothetical protein
LRRGAVWGDDIDNVRYVLALALVLQFSGVPAAAAKRCPMSPARGEHACCLARQGGPVTHITGSCGCQMTPGPAGGWPSSVSTAPETGAHRGAPVADANLAFAPALLLDSRPDAQRPPGSGGGVSLSRLSGSGFRC